MREISLRLIATLAIAAGIAGCGGYTPVRYPAVAAPDMLTRVVANPNFRAIDGASFADTVVQYPTRTGSSHHIIPIGDYLLSRTVLALPADAAITSLRLVEFRSICRASSFVAPQARCATKARFSIVTREGERNIEVEVEPDVGPLFIPGDMAPPFTMGDPLIEALHEEARRTVDALQVRMSEAFSAMPRRAM